MAANIIVFWNALYTDAVMEQWRTDGYPIYEHINLLGCHIFVLPEMVAREQLRPLRRPADPIE